MASNAHSNLASRYTKALFSLANDARALDAVERDFAALKEALAATPELSRLFANPILPREAKAAAMDAVLSRMKASDATRRFVRRLSLNQRLSALPAIIEAYEEMLTAQRGELVLDVISARKLDARQEKDLGDALARANGCKVRLRTKVDPALIGGLVIKSGGRMLDYSVKSKLAQLERALKQQVA